MEILAQTSTAQSSSAAAATALILMAIMIVFAIIWQISLKQEFEDARREFEGDPTNLSKKQRLINAGRYRNGRGGYSGGAMDVLSVIAEAEDRERKRKAKKGEFADQLETLSQLHQRGELSDEEFKKAKAKLLST